MFTVLNVSSARELVPCSRHLIFAITSLIVLAPGRRTVRVQSIMKGKARTG